jgi:Flp pilus assembly protein TadG
VNGHADRDGEGGQATVELALVLPLVILFALAVIQVGVLVHDQLLVAAAAREAVRAAAVTGSDGDAGGSARAAAGTVGHLDGGRLGVAVSRDPGAGGQPVVRVRATYAAATVVPVVGALLPDVTLSAEAVMRSES